jgi:hypothetical protein
MLKCNVIIYSGFEITIFPSLSYRKVHERGLQRRENLRFYHAKPECTQRGTSFVSVGLVDSYSAVLVLGYGMLLSLVILLMEVMVHRR